MGDTFLACAQQSQQSLQSVEAFPQQHLHSVDAGISIGVFLTFSAILCDADKPSAAPKCVSRALAVAFARLMLQERFRWGQSMGLLAQVIMADDTQASGCTL